MKLFGALIVAASAQTEGLGSWPGQEDAVGKTCGSVTVIDANPVNSTCTIDTGAFNAVFMSVASAFPLSANTYTGFEGISEGPQSVLVFWEEHVGADGEMDNSTCGTAADITITCVDNGAADATPNLVGNFVMDPRQTSFGVPVANGDENFAIDLGKFGAITNMTQGPCAEAQVSTGSVYSCDLSANNGDLAYFEFNGAAGNSNF